MIQLLIHAHVKWSYLNLLSEVSKLLDYQV